MGSTGPTVGSELAAGASGAAQGAAEGSVVPVVGTIIGAFVGWIKGIVSQGRVKFAIPFSAEQSYAALALAQLDPSILFLGPNFGPEVIGEQRAQQMIAFPYVTSGSDAAGFALWLAHTANYPIFQPNSSTDPNDQESIDPSVTDVTLGQQFANLDVLHVPTLDAIYSAMQNGTWHPSSPPTMSSYDSHGRYRRGPATRAQAQKILTELRQYPDATAWLVDPNRVPTSYLPILAGEIRNLRVIAGENGADTTLSKVFGDVTVYPPPAGYGAPTTPTGKYRSTIRYNADGSAMQTFTDGSYRTYATDGSAKVYTAFGTPTGTTWAARTFPTPVGGNVLGTHVRFLNRPDEVASSWWWVGVSSAAGLILGGALLYRERHRAGVSNALAETSTAAADEDPGRAAFRRVLREGISDGELEYLRSGMRDMLYFHKAFGDARTLGIPPTHLAATGRYFGEEPLPIRIEVYPDGSVHLADGRHRYTAAKMAGAREILARVVLYDGDGVDVAERVTVVKLL